MRDTSEARERLDFTALLDKQNNPSLVLRGPLPPHPQPPQETLRRPNHATCPRLRSKFLSDHPARPRSDLPRPQTKTVSTTRFLLIFNKSSMTSVATNQEDGAMPEIVFKRLRWRPRPGRRQLRGRRRRRSGKKLCDRFSNSWTQDIIAVDVGAVSKTISNPFLFG